MAHEENISPAEIVKRLRKKRGLATQKAIADRLGMTAPAVTKWENGGAASPNSMQRLLDLLDEPEIDTNEDGPPRASKRESSKPILASSTTQNISVNEAFYCDLLKRILRSGRNEDIRVTMRIIEMMAMTTGSSPISMENDLPRADSGG